ncbi:MAG: glycogen synthase [Vicinamibacterales bacterium]
MIASEVQPYSKTGGLADVAAALPRALGRLGHDVTVLTPRYRGIDAGTLHGTISVRLGDYRFEAGLYDESLGPGARLLFVDCPPLYHRDGIYNERNVDYADNALRFAVLNAAAIDWAAAQAVPFSIVHAHDWQAGLVPIYLRTRAGDSVRVVDAPPAAKRRAASKSPPALSTVPCVFTIHNLAYQGIFNKEWVPRLELGWERFTVRGFEFWDRLSFLKAGVMFADLITTVSPTYAEEIQRPEYGYGLDGVMRARRDELIGIVNGIDTDVWNPAHDEHVPAPFDVEDLSGKIAAKRALLVAFGLPVDDAVMARPIVGMVSRMVDQKGFDLIEAAAELFPSLDATYVIVGSGDPRYQELWRRLAASWPDRVAAFIGFDERRAHLVEAGSDVFLMPSRFEPCGLNQMYSLRYGTVPVVRAVGGLVDTVRPFDPKTGQGTGFLFADYHPDALLEALQQALAVYRNARLWRRLQQSGMRKDFSWGRSAAEYVKVYKRVIARRNRTPGGGDASELRSQRHADNSGA